MTFRHLFALQDQVGHLPMRILQDDGERRGGHAGLGGDALEGRRARMRRERLIGIDRVTVGADRAGKCMPLLRVADIVLGGCRGRAEAEKAKISDAKTRMEASAFCARGRNTEQTAPGRDVRN